MIDPQDLHDARETALPHPHTCAAGLRWRFFLHSQAVDEGGGGHKTLKSDDIETDMTS